MLRTQVDPRSGQARPHNRLRDGAQYADGAIDPDMQFMLPPVQPPGQRQLQIDPGVFPQPSGQSSQPPGQSSAPDLNALLGQVGQATDGFSGPNFQLPGISGLAAGGGLSVGPDGIEIQSPNQAPLYDSYMDTVSALGTGQQNLVGSVIGNMLGLTGQLGTASINANANRDVAGIQGQTQENVALTQAQSAAEVAGIQAQSANEIEGMRQAGLISELESQERIAGLNNASQQRIAEIQAQASTRPAELQYQQFTDSMDRLDPFFSQLLQMFGGGGGITGSSDTAYQVDPQALVNSAQAANAQATASQNRAGAPGGGAAANSAASREAAQRLAAMNAQAAYEIPLQVGQQNFNNQQAARGNDLQQLSSLLQFLPNVLNSV